MKYSRRTTTIQTWISNERFFDFADIDDEVWKEFSEIRGVTLATAHEVSNKGRVRRLSGKLNQGSISEDGYHEMHFSVPDSYGIDARVHIIVLTAFQGPPPQDMIHPTVQHINHDKLDNRIENLCWMSEFDNNQEGHGVRVKLVDEFGEHIFNSQKVASAYVGRYEDYVSECIREGYKIKRSTDNQELTAYIEINHSWKLHTPIEPKNKKKCKLIIEETEYLFNSLWECDRFLQKPQGYTSTMLNNSWPIINKFHKFYIFDYTVNDYVLYQPTSSKKRNYANSCQIAENGKVITFPSIMQAAKYLGRDSESLRTRLKKYKSIVSKNRCDDKVTVTLLDD